MRRQDAALGHRFFTLHRGFQAISRPIEDLADSADIMLLFLFLQVNLAVISLRKRRPDLDRGFVIPLFPWLSILGIVLLLSLALYMLAYGPKAWIVTASWVAAGLLVYKGYASKREVENVRKVQALSRIERREYRMLVCLSHPTKTMRPSRLVVAFARKNRAAITFLHVVEVEEGETDRSRRGDLPSWRAFVRGCEPHRASFR